MYTPTNINISTINYSQLYDKTNHHQQQQNFQHSSKVSSNYEEISIPDEISAIIKANDFNDNQTEQGHFNGLNQFYNVPISYETYEDNFNPVFHELQQSQTNRVNCYSVQNSQYSNLNETNYLIDSNILKNLQISNTKMNNAAQSRQTKACHSMTDGKPFCTIVEQPAKCAMRFRYECEGRSAGSLPGANSTTDNKTFPTIQIQNYAGRAVVVVSCVTKDQPYKPHPHKIVGKEAEGCKKGICTIVMQNEHDMVRSFPNLGIQCVKRKDIEESLSLRESIKVDPFRTGFMHKKSTSSIDLNVVRLCFQVFIEGPGTNKCDVPLTPIVSDPIHDKKAMSDLVITKLSHCSAPATGGREVILLCDRISKDDIQIRFFEERNGEVVWEAYAEFSPFDVHKQVAISFKSPKYYNENIQHPVKVNVQLKRISDNQVSEPRTFQFLPCESDDDIISRKRQKISAVNLDSYVLDNILHPQQHRQQNVFNNIEQNSEQSRPTTASANRTPPVENQLIHNNAFNIDSMTNRRPSLSRSQCPANIRHRGQYEMIVTNNLNQQLHQQAPSSRQHTPSPNQQQLICQPKSIKSRVNSTDARMSVDESEQMQQGQLAVQESIRVNIQNNQPQGLYNQFNNSQQQNYFNESQNIVVRHEIIAKDGSVTQVVDRPNIQPSGSNYEKGRNQAGTSANLPKLDTLDQINTAELMPAMNFGSNMDLNLGSRFSLTNFNGTANMSLEQYEQKESQLLENSKETNKRFDSSNTLNTPQVSELDPKPFDNMK